jgi:hypothetical protein
VLVDNFDRALINEHKNLALEYSSAMRKLTQTEKHLKDLTELAKDAILASKHAEIFSGAFKRLDNLILKQKKERG